METAAPDFIHGDASKTKWPPSLSKIISPGHFVFDASPCIKIWGRLPDHTFVYTWRRAKDKMAENAIEKHLSRPFCIRRVTMYKNLGPPPRPTWQVNLPAQPGRSTCQINLPGQPTRSTWQINLAGQPARSTCQVNLAGQLGRSTCQVNLPGQPGSSKILSNYSNP